MSKLFRYSLIICSALLPVYFGYNNYHEKKRLQIENAELFGKIERLNQSIAKNNQIIADNERNKRDLENQSLERLEQINEQLKNNHCANEYVPVSVADSMYNRAKSLRQSADTSESTNRQHSRAAAKIHEIRR
jgi:MFS superfamily sulfate permease-like transporter